jgi:cobalt/nickel transport system ATP-binding protein
VGRSIDRVIDVRGYGFSYDGRSPALKNICLEAFRGERVGIVGANGAGKSTLLMSLVGILRGQGSIVVDGTVLRGGSLKEIRKKIGFVFQNPDDQLFSTTVFDDVAFGPLNMGLPPEEVKARVLGALRRVEMEGFEKSLPHHLSAGEKKRIAIATALAMQPEILVLDEPSSSLDSGVRKKLMDLVLGFDTTLVVASHDLDLVSRLCSRVYLLRKGEIIAEGASSALLSDGGLMRSAGLEPILPGGRPA